MEHSWISLYRERGISQCMEATFDSVRENVASWLGLGAVLFLPSALGLATMTTINRNGMYYEDDVWISSLFKVVDAYSPFSYLLLFLGLWGAHLLSYTLLKASQDGRLPGKRLQFAEARKYMRPMLVKTFVVSLFVALTYFLLSLHVLFWLLFLVVGVPLMLLTPIWIIEDDGFIDAFNKCFRLGYVSWFQMVVIFLFMMMLGFLMTFSVFLFWSLSTMFMESVMMEGYSSYSFVAQVLMFISSLLLVYAFFLVLSMVLLSCVYHYGNVSEEQDDTSIESDIENFENL
uniref:Membrane protein n=1 Tax=uncultured bacterium Csd4 TaxID=1637487 RepID=A0A0F6YSI9_9BACT|nr:membrane protein [uncultured bacterium Csd4]